MKWLSTIALALFLEGLSLGTSSRSSFAAESSPRGVSSEDSAEQEPQGDPLPLPEFSMADVDGLKLRGGNYWLGYFIYRVDLDRGLMSASWNVFDCTMKAYEAEVKLNDKDIKAIQQAVEALQYEVLGKDDECHLMADGDESSLTLIHPGDDDSVLPFYPMKSWASRCIGKPISDASYQSVEDVIFTLLPHPEDTSLYHELNPTEICEFESP